MTTLRTKWKKTLREFEATTPFNWKKGLNWAAASLAVGCIGVGSSAYAQSAGSCTVQAVRNFTDAGGVCSCTNISRSAISYIQSAENFDDLLGYFSQACPEMAAVLTDVPVATINEPRVGDRDDKSDGTNSGSRFPMSNGASDNGDDDGDKWKHKRKHKAKHKRKHKRHEGNRARRHKHEGGRNRMHKRKRGHDRFEQEAT